MTAANTSANTTDTQMPFSFQIRGSTITIEQRNTNVRKKESKAETAPSLSAVKKAEPKTGSPVSKKENEKILNA